MFRVTYYDKDGRGFCGGKEPWRLDEFDNQTEAEKEKNRLISEGYRNVSMAEVDMTEEEN